MYRDYREVYYADSILRVGPETMSCIPLLFGGRTHRAVVPIKKATSGILHILNFDVEGQEPGYKGMQNYK